MNPISFVGPALRGLKIALPVLSRGFTVAVKKLDPVLGKLGVRADAAPNAAGLGVVATAAAAWFGYDPASLRAVLVGGADLFAKLSDMSRTLAGLMG